MKLKNLIHQLSGENSAMGEVTREIEKDENYSEYKDEKRLKDYLNKKMLKKGMHDAYISVLLTHELINFQTMFEEK